MSIKLHRVHDLLHMSEGLYNQLWDERYLLWCSLRAKDERADYQMLMANAGINKWYRREFEKLENQFVEMALPLHTRISVKAARELYTSNVEDIFNKYPMPLLEAARTLKIINTYPNE